MTALSQHSNDDSQSRRDADLAQVDIVPTSKRPTFSVVRVVIGTGVATGAALLGVFIGLPVIAATAVGAGVGGGAVAMMSAHGAPLRR